MAGKKIALFISHIYGEYQRNLSQGIIDKALEYGYQTEIYTTNDGEDLGGLTDTEKCLLELPVYSGLSGVIFASGTYSSPIFKTSISDLLKKTGLPVIEVNDTSHDFPNVTMDNNTMFAMIAEHFITMHGASRICYLGCKNEREISDIRLNIISDTMQKNALSFTDKDTYLCDESPEDYTRAVNFLTDNGESVPDAILCYNDRLAYELIITAENMGFNIPGDFGVSGCDNSAAGQNMVPPLTTISYPVYGLGQIAVDNLRNLIKGRDLSNTSVFAKVIYGGSCGCSHGGDKKVHFYSHALQNQIADLERSMIVTARTASLFDKVEDIEDSLDILSENTDKIRGCTGFYLALRSDWDRLSDRILTLTASTDPQTGADDTANDEMILVFASRNGKRLPGSTFKCTELLPDYVLSDTENARIVSPVYHHGNAYGYVVLTFENDRIQYPFHLVQYLVNLSQLLNNLRNRKRSDAMVTHLEDIYFKDGLTGLFNKAGFDHYKERFEAGISPDSTVSVIYADMNGLNAINDTYGHDAGDFAIRILGQAISRAVNDDEIAGRTGGDEFVILINGDVERAEEIEKRILSYLDNYRKLNPGKYEITASIGTASSKVSSAFSLDALIKEADSQMYEHKNRHPRA